MRQWLANYRNVSSILAVMLIILSFSGVAFAGVRTTSKDQVNISDPRLDGATQNNLLTNQLQEGFFGRKWGVMAEGFKSDIHIADLPDGIAVYAADIDVSPVLGEGQAYSSPRLVYHNNSGLQKVYIAFAENEYADVENHLKQVLGEPVPIVYELWAGRVDYMERSEWHIGKETKLVLTKRTTSAVIEITSRSSSVPGERELEGALAAVQIKQAQEFERQNRLLEASTVYQDVLNQTGTDNQYTLMAKERLAALSCLDKITEYLSGDAGIVFRGLKNQFPVSTKQFWLRIDFEPSMQAELQKKMADEMGQAEGVPAISAVLCRLKPVKGQTFKLMEQVWLDDSNKIIGTRDAGMHQGSGWPASYIRKASEQFMQDWFSLGHKTIQ